MMNRFAHIVVLTVLFPLGLLLCFGSCGDSPVKSDPKDKTPPTVLNTVPTDGASTVSVHSAISVTFSEAMNQSTMVAGTVVLNPSAAGTIGYSGNVLTLTPTSGLDTNITYHATVTTAAKDTAGNALATAYVWEFTTYADTVRPTVTSTDPGEGDSATVNSSIVVNFSEAMDTTTLNGTNITFSPDISGTFAHISKQQVTITPSQPLELPGDYTATITTAVRDSAGNHLAAPYVWHFHTIADAVPPTIALVGPVNNTVFKDSIIIKVNASDNDRINRVEFYADGAHIVGADDTTYPYEGIWKPTGLVLGTNHTVYAVAYDDTGNSATTAIDTVHYLWRLLVEDNNESIPRNLSRIYARTTNLKLQFRIETYNGWSDYKNAETGIDVAIFIDVDQDSTTGARTVNNLVQPIPIGDIGADYRLVIGNHGDSVGRWTGTSWTGQGLVEDLSITNNSNFFEVSLSLTRINNPQVANVVVANATRNSVAELLQWDWAPNAGHVTINIDRSFSGAPPSGSNVMQSASSYCPTPFN